MNKPVKFLPLIGLALCIFFTSGSSIICYSNIYSTETKSNDSICFEAQDTFMCLLLESDTIEMPILNISLSIEELNSYCSKMRTLDSALMLKYQALKQNLISQKEYEVFKTFNRYHIFNKIDTLFFHSFDTVTINSKLISLYYISYGANVLDHSINSNHNKFTFVYSSEFGLLTLADQNRFVDEDRLYDYWTANLIQSPLFDHGENLDKLIDRTNAMLYGDCIFARLILSNH